MPDEAERRDLGEQQEQEVPLGHQRQAAQDAARTAVAPLEEAGAPDAVVDRGAGAVQDVRHALRVQAARPRDVTGGVVFLRPLALEQRLGLAVADLLAPEAADGVAAAVPDDRGRVEAERPALRLELPADVDVVARRAELR